MATAPEIKSFMRKPHGYPTSRDHFWEHPPCACTVCHCNSGSGRCVVPSKMDIGPDAVCRTGKKAIEQEQARQLMRTPPTT